VDGSAPPNIILFYVDDLGYGDPGCYGGTTAPTPNIDRLAREGVRFTDGHSGAATCTPSRYSLLTGRYAFRREANVLAGNAPLLIDTARQTLADVLVDAGYATGVVGKWHLGLGDGSLDWNGAIRPGPLELGFDYAFLIPATGDRTPTVYVENHRIVGLQPDDPLQVAYDGPFPGEPTGTQQPELLRYGADPQHSGAIVNGISRIGYQTGGQAATWTDEDFADTLGHRATTFIRGHTDRPFFLYYSFHDIHVPRLPHPRFRGRSEGGWRGDAIVQADAMVGAVLDELDRLGLTDNTLVILTSDNGPVLDDGYADDAVATVGDHDPSGPWRGGKYSAFEAGTRVPTIVRWPARVRPGLTSSALIGQIDLLPSLAGLTEVDALGELDGQDQLAAWLGEDPTGRKDLLEESYTLSLREGPWKYIDPTQATQGWIQVDKGIEGGLSTDPQLYNLANDPGETVNLATRYPARVGEMKNRLLRQVARE
jgi:arylsulfatase A-like enzyme